MGKDIKKTSEETPELIKVKFLISPTGAFNLAYAEGEEGLLPEAQANELEEAGFVKFVK